jgi:hypothetical protein
VGSPSDGADRQVPLKYAKTSDISDDAFLTAAREVTGGVDGGHARLHEIAWRLSDYGVPDKLVSAPDVNEFALQNKANSLALRRQIQHLKDTLYSIPAAPKHD